MNYRIPVRFVMCLSALLYVSGCKPPPPIGDGGGVDGDSDGGLPEDGGAGQLPDLLPTHCGLVGAEQQISNGTGATSPVLLWDGDHYVLAYGDLTTGNGDIYVARLAADGTVTVPPAPVEATPAQSGLPTIAKSAAGYVVAWEEGPGPSDVRVHAIDNNLQPIGVGRTIATPVSTESRPIIRTAFGAQVVAWMDKTGGIPAVYVAQLDGGLQIMNSPVRLGLSTAAASFPWLVSDASSLGVIWSDQRTGNFNIRFARLDNQLVASSETVIRDAPNDGQLGRIIQTTTGYLSAWEDTRDLNSNAIYMALTDTSGAVMSSGLVEELNSGDANWPNMAWDGTAAGVVYYQYRGSAPQIFISFIDATGQRVGGGADLQISNTPSGKSAKFPDVQWNGSEFGVTWLDTRNAAPQIYFANVTCH